MFREILASATFYSKLRYRHDALSIVKITSNSNVGRDKLPKACTRRTFIVRSIARRNASDVQVEKLLVASVTARGLFGEYRESREYDAVVGGRSFYLDAVRRWAHAKALPPRLAGTVFPGRLTLLLGTIPSGGTLRWGGDRGSTRRVPRSSRPDTKRHCQRERPRRTLRAIPRKPRGGTWQNAKGDETTFFNVRGDVV